MTNYHKPESKTVQELKDIAHRLRIHSINATQASNSGLVIHLKIRKMIRYDLFEGAYTQFKCDCKVINCKCDLITNLYAMTYKVTSRKFM